MSSSSSTSADINSNEQNRNWLDLPSDVTTNIIHRIGVVDILENAQKVCTAWRKICKDPAMWRVIKIHILSSYEEKMCKQAVDRSQGQLVDLSIRSCNDELLSYVADRSRQLRRLELVSLIYVDVTKLPLMKFPLLEELNFYSTQVFVTKEFIETVGRYSPMLKTLKVNHTITYVMGYYDDVVAKAIGENLHELRHLELIGNNILSTGLEAILDGCRHLETLDLRNCLEFDLTGDLEKRCFEQIKTLKLPDDSLEGSPYVDVYDEDLAVLFNTDFSKLFDVEAIMSSIRDSIDSMSS